MQSKREILQKALENINHPLSEITRRTTYRGHSPGVKPTTGIKLNLPKTSTMAAKMERVLADKSPEGRKRMKQMNNLVIGREEDGDKISLEFKTTASRERFRKMMNELSENVHLDEMKKSDGPFTVMAIKNNKVVRQVHSIEHHEIEDAIELMKTMTGMKGAKISVESNKGRIVHTEGVQLDEGRIDFVFDIAKYADEFARRVKRDHLASEVKRSVDRSSAKPKEVVTVIGQPNAYERYTIRRLANGYDGEFFYTDLGREVEKMMREDVQLDENVQNQVKRMDRRAKEKLAKQLNDLDLSGYGDYEARIDNVHKFKPSDLKMALEMMSESFSMSLDEKQKMTYVIDRKTKKIVHGPTGVADAKRYLEKQIQPRKFMIRDIRGAAKKVGDIV